MNAYPSLSLQDRRQNLTALAAFNELSAKLELGLNQDLGSGPILELEPSFRRSWIRIIILDLAAQSSGRFDWSFDTIRQALITLKLLGRSAVATDDLASHLPLFTRYANLLPLLSPQSDAPSTSAHQTLHPFHPAIAEQSLRILANTLFLHPLARASSDLLLALASLVDTALTNPALPTPSPEPHEPTAHNDAPISTPTHMFLAARVLFLITAGPSALVLEIVDNTPFVSDLVDTLRRESQPGDHHLPSDVLIEHLKLIFNLMVQYPRSIKEFRPKPGPNISNSPFLLHHHYNISSSTNSSDSKLNKIPPLSLGTTTRPELGARRPSIKQRFVNQINLSKLARQKAKLTSSKINKEFSESARLVQGDQDQTSEISSLNSSPRISLSAEEDLAITWPDPENKVFVHLLPYLIQLFLNEPLCTPPTLKAPLSSYIHTFLNFPSCPSFYFTHYKSNPNYTLEKGIPPILTKLLTIIESVTSFYCGIDEPDSITVKQKCEDHDMDLDNNLTHVIVLLVNLLSPTKNNNTHQLLSEESRRLIQEKIIPRNIDRSIGLNKQDNLIGRLLRLMNSIAFNNLKVTCGGFLYALFNEDADHLVSQVGYGPIAGYLMTIGKPAMNQTTTHQPPANVNPVTGAYYTSSASSEDLSPTNQMTDEEKEKEAERLCDLFDRMNKNGIIKVEDPRRQAVESGKLMEIDDKFGLDEDEQDAKDEEEAVEEMRKYKERLKSKR